MQHFTKVEFDNFKAFEQFHLDLKNFNILVGPNNGNYILYLAGMICQTIRDRPVLSLKSTSR